MSKRLNIEQLQKLGIKIPASEIPKTDKKYSTKEGKNIPKQEPDAIRTIKQNLSILKIHFETEYRFHPTRKFRFDIVLENEKIAIEYEGINSEKSRHTNIEGYTNDCRKYNLAQSMGWKVLRFTALNYKEFLSELDKFIKIK